MRLRLDLALLQVDDGEREALAILKRFRQRPPAPVWLDADDDDEAPDDAAGALDAHAVDARARVDELAAMEFLFDKLKVTKTNQESFDAMKSKA